MSWLPIFFNHNSNSALKFLRTDQTELMQCLPVIFSKSGVFSRKSDPKPEINGPEFPVHFRSGKEVRNLVCFESPEIRPKIGPKKWSKMTHKLQNFGHFLPVISTRLALDRFLDGSKVALCCILEQCYKLRKCVKSWEPTCLCNTCTAI
jgi:hypothetical protein